MGVALKPSAGPPENLGILNLDLIPKINHPIKMDHLDIVLTIPFQKNWNQSVKNITMAIFVRPPRFP